MYDSSADCFYCVSFAYVSGLVGDEMKGKTRV